ncbi:MAG: alkaline phosphatase [Sedimentisphaerales bacterium]|nr:alkaline phosphatase [Sedimentisphaerales bacterium]
MKQIIYSICILLFVANASFAQLQPLDGTAKYVFLFIGDGMGFAQVHSAEAYLDTLEQGTTEGPRDVRANKLAMTAELPFAGAISTYDYGVLITDSASAGTALACGKKTYSGVVSVDPQTKTIPYKTIAEVAKEHGMRVGIVTSVSIDHATPAVFYAHSASRNDYHGIGMQIAASGFDYFGGGGLLQQIKNGEDTIVAVQNAGYQVVTTHQDLAAVAPGQKVLAINSILDGSKALSYEIDRDVNDMSLADFTSEGIRLLDNPNGFFMMVEGGKIDWTCHANDGRTSIDDVLAFDNAVMKALDFAMLHPNETLVIVTADHETGGLTQGWAGTKYASAYEKMQGQTMSYLSFTDFVKGIAADSNKFWLDPNSNLVDDTDMLAAIENAFGLVYSQLTDFQKKQLEDGYDRSMKGSRIVSSEEDYLLYGGYDALTVTCTHILNNLAGLGWTSYSHTAIPVPVFSNDARFNGYYDNTMIPHKIADSIGLSGALD